MLPGARAETTPNMDVRSRPRNPRATTSPRHHGRPCPSRAACQDPHRHGVRDLPAAHGRTRGPSPRTTTTTQDNAHHHPLPAPFPISREGGGPTTTSTPELDATTGRLPVHRPASTLTPPRSHHPIPYLPPLNHHHLPGFVADPVRTISTRVRPTRSAGGVSDKPGHTQPQPPDPSTPASTRTYKDRSTTRQNSRASTRARA